MNSNLHVVSDRRGRPIRMDLSAGQTSDYIGAAALLSTLPKAGALLADRGYDADWFRNALIARDIQPCIPSRKNRKVAIPHDKSAGGRLRKTLLVSLDDLLAVVREFLNPDVFRSGLDRCLGGMGWEICATFRRKTPGRSTRRSRPTSPATHCPAGDRLRSPRGGISM
jgi:transposase